jgi:hypothetical protein
MDKKKFTQIYPGIKDGHNHKTFAPKELVIELMGAEIIGEFEEEGTNDCATKFGGTEVEAVKVIYSTFLKLNPLPK